MIAYIDNINIYTQFGVAISEKGYNDLVQYPSLKKVESNNWAEKDGIEPDLSNPTLDTKSVSIPFFAHGYGSNVEGLLELLSDGAYHIFRFVELGKEFKLRLTEMPDLESLRSLSIFSLKFADDFPLLDYEYLAPSTIGRNQGYELDDLNFSAYGITVLSNLDEIKKSPKVKKNLLRNINSLHGVIYSDKKLVVDGIKIPKPIVYEAKDVTLDLFMRTSTMTEFWQNYNAFLYDLTRVNERQLYVDNNTFGYPCFYKNSKIEEFFPAHANHKSWCKFSIALTFTSFRVEGIEDVEYILCSESGELVTTEDGELLLI